MLALPADSSCCTPRRCPGNPRDGHTLATVVRATEGLTGRAIERGYVDKKYRCYYMPNPQRYLHLGQKRGIFGVVKRELRRC
jgi:transposase, IS5 family